MLLQDTNLSMQGLQSPVSGSFKTCLLPTVKIWFAIGGGRSIRYGIKKIWTVMMSTQDDAVQTTSRKWTVLKVYMEFARCWLYHNSQPMSVFEGWYGNVEEIWVQDISREKNNRKMQERHFAPTESTTRAKKIYKRIQGVQWSKFLFVRMFLKNTCG